MIYENPWLYNEKVFTSEDILDYYGFCYIITNLDNAKQYIGRKYFYSTRKKKGIKKRIKTESDWMDYYGSSKSLKEIISESTVDNFSREILSLHKTKGQVNYTETKLLFQHDVLEALNNKGERLYYNEQIMNRYFAVNISPSKIIK